MALKKIKHLYKFKNITEVNPDTYQDHATWENI